MTLLDRSRAARARLQEERNLKKETAEAKPFETRARQLMDLRDRIAPLRKQVEALMTLEHPPALPPNYAGTLRQRLTDNREALMEAGDTKTFRFGVQKSAEAFCDETIEGIEAAWMALVKATAPVGDLGFLRALRSLPTLKEPAGRALEHLEAIHTLSETVPSDIAADHARISVHADKYRKEAESLRLDGVPPAVRVFLDKARTQAGVTLDQLTPEIRDWLDENSLTKHFNLRAGA